MYLEHFGLQEAPFRITPDTERFFAGGNRGAILDALLYAVTQEEGIVKVTGEVGSGKTMLCRMLLDRLPTNIETLYIAQPTLTSDEVLDALADELGLDTSTEGTRRRLLQIQEALVRRFTEGRRVVVLIDEAHAMPSTTLETVRLLSNLETRQEKLLQLVLFGQPELDAHLAETILRPLKERITHHFVLPPLRDRDIPAYLDFRLRAVGYQGTTPFSPAAQRRIARISAGLTRRINILADKGLLSAFAADRHEVTSHDILAAQQDAQVGLTAPTVTPWGHAARRLASPWLYATLALVVLGSLAALAGYNLGRGISLAPPASTSQHVALTAQPDAETLPLNTTTAALPVETRTVRSAPRHLAQLKPGDISDN